MKHFVVGYINWFDHELYLEYIEAYCWQAAVSQHPKCTEHLASYPDLLNAELEDVKRYMFNQDAMLNVLELPS